MEILDKKIAKIHNYIYANEGLSNSETLHEFLKIFYCKILDEQNDNLLSSNTEENKLLIIYNLYNIYKFKMKNIVDPEEKINLRASTIIYIINELKDIKLNAISPDTKGHILQKIIDRSYRESRGQFFTPAPVVDFVVKMIAPKSSEIGCDPACGTGGFMFTALEYINSKRKINKSSLNNIYFYDISKNLIDLIAMRMMFEFSNDKPNFEVKDSIAEEYDKKFDYVLTNPPFGTQGKISDYSTLSKYDLGKNQKNQVPDILFVEKVIKILKENGRGAIVLPDGDFENPSLAYFRRYLVENIKIDAIISLPDGTFIPYGTGVKSSIIFLSKVNRKKINDLLSNNYEIFYGKITKLGYSFSKHSKDMYKKSGEINEDYNEIVSAYFEKRYNDNAYLVPINEIINNNYILSENFHSPFYKRKINEIKEKKHAKLKDICEFNYVKEKIDKEALYNYIEIGDISPYTNEIINSSELYGADLPSRASYILKENDIIVATAGGAIGTRKHAKALVSKKHIGCICTNGFNVLKATKYSPYFLIHFLTVMILKNKY